MIIPLSGNMLSGDVMAPALLSVCFVGSLWLLKSPSTAPIGNLLSATLMMVSVTLVATNSGASADASALVLLAVGSGVGVALGRWTSMIAIPQLIAILNGCGGLASALVAFAIIGAQDLPVLATFVAGLAVAVGLVTASGSAVAAMKLGGIGSSYPGAARRVLWFCLLVGVTMVVVVMVADVERIVGVLLPVLATSSLAYGVYLASRVGGADMPILISLMNAMSGVAAAVSGILVGSLLVAAVGGIVGIGGLVLTHAMCGAMNRSLRSVLAGVKWIASGSAEAEAAPVGVDPSPANVEQRTEGVAVSGTRRGVSEGRHAAARVLLDASRVVIVPGYGMARAGAQVEVRYLVEWLIAAGKEASIVVHPVAGRMPGHMHVLLAEAGVRHRLVHDMQTITPAMITGSCAVVVGACDIVNPSATTVPGTPISGMPVVGVSHAKSVIVCNLDANPGYSGVPNSLYEQPNVIGLWGDAKESLTELLAALSGDTGGDGSDHREAPA